jgi:hypothetical protein
MARVAWLAAVAAAVAVTACSAAHPAHRARPRRRGLTATAARRPRRLPCRAQRAAAGAWRELRHRWLRARPLLSGALPTWTASASPPAMIYVLGRHRQVAGFLFGFPLMAGHPEPQSDKILWVVRSDRHGAPLRLTGHPLNAATPVVRSSWPANSSPGNIFPSDIEVPAPGCWRFTLAWHRHTDTVDLWYVAHR